MITKYEVSPETFQAVMRLYKEAKRSPQTVFEDEDTVTFTRAEVVAIWQYVMGTNQELSDRRNADPDA